MWILLTDVSAPLWVWLLFGGAVAALLAFLTCRWRAAVHLRLHADAQKLAADARRLEDWHNRVWARWQTRVAEHARHYDTYWEQVCAGLLKVYTERAGDARLQSLVRGALQEGTSPRSIAHGLAAHYAPDPEFVRRHSGFARRGTSSGRGRP